MIGNFTIFIKGKACSSDKDCPTTDPLIYAKCKCGHNAKGLKYCDVEGGDEEWKTAFDKVSNSSKFYFFLIKLT